MPETARANASSPRICDGDPHARDKRKMADDDDVQGGIPVCMPDPDALDDLMSMIPKWTEEPTIEALHIFPIKACRGVKVKSAKVTATGFEHDRAWCVVDLEGAVVARCEAISQRKVPSLATVTVEMSEDGGSLLLDAPGMPRLVLPTSPSAYAAEPNVQVQCSGVSTTTDGGWWLGEQPCKQHVEASDWFTEYLNRDAADPAKPGYRISGSKKATTFALCRSVAPRGLELSSYPAVFPLTENAAKDPRMVGNSRRFADFAPFLLANKTSASFVAKRAGIESYPVEPFRANIILATRKPWAEETWKSLTIHAKTRRRAQENGASDDSTALLTMSKIKECPRCTVPCRDGVSGNFLFPSDKLLLWRVLKKAFPTKFSDPEWGTWSGAFFGVYFGHKGVAGATITVGDRLVIEESCRWDDHLPSGKAAKLRMQACQAVTAVAAAAVAVFVATSEW